LKCNALGRGFCPSRQGRVLAASEEKGEEIVEKEFCLHLEDKQCTFNLKGQTK
jgi:hypothetical protein